MTHFGKRVPHVEQFQKDTQGSIAIIFALCLSIIIVVVGAAIDFGRWQNARATTLSAMDGAVLAGGRYMQLNPGDTNGALAAANRYYRENVKDKVSFTNDTVEFVMAESNSVLTAEGGADVETTFLRFAGLDKLSVVNENASDFPRAVIESGGLGGSNLEVSVMLDVTGSMCDDGVGPCSSGSKIDALKSATQELINIVVKDDQTSHYSKVALVPFSTRVRLAEDGMGAGIMQTLTGLPSPLSFWNNDCTSWSGSGGGETGGTWTCHSYAPAYKTNWKVMPCVTERHFNSGDVFDTTDSMPGAGNWLNAHDGGRALLSWDSSDTAISPTYGTTSADPADHWNYNDDGECGDIAEGNEVMPLSSNKSALLSHVDGLSAYGATGGALGTTWAWYALSPNFASVFTGEGVPGAYADLTTAGPGGGPLLRKVAVLMTDGGYNAYRGWKDQPQQEVSDRALEICTAMKTAGVEVYTVGFALNELPADEAAIARTTLQSCGTDIEHFYETLTREDLESAFRDISVRLSALRLSR